MWWQVLKMQLRSLNTQIRYQYDNWPWRGSPVDESSVACSAFPLSPRPCKKHNISSYHNKTMMITIITLLLSLLIRSRFHHQRSFSLEFLNFHFILVIFWVIYPAYMLPHLLRLLLMRLRFLSPRVCCCWPAPPPLFGRIFKICDVLSDCRW